ncbi:MAG: hypothetical protein K6E47_09425 [Lachnospiraceae bacterium]|nr:hypothetical protein [Lachnospiraceae bacterium]
MKKIGLILLVAILAISIPSSVLAFADYADITKEIFGSNAPEFPETPKQDVPYYIATEEYDENEEFNDPVDLSVWTAYFDYMKKNDPNYVSGGTVVDDRPGDIVFIKAAKEAAKAVNYKTLFENSTKIYEAAEVAIDKAIDKSGIFYIATPFLVWDTMYVSWIDNAYTDEELYTALKTAMSINDATNGKITKNADNDYLITFDGVWSDENWKRHHTKTEIIAKADGETGRLCMHETEVIQDTNETRYTLYEFVPLANDVYIMQSGTERLYAVYNEETGLRDYVYIQLDNNRFSIEDAIYDATIENPSEWVLERADRAAIIVTCKDGKTTIERPGKPDVVVE